MSSVVVTTPEELGRIVDAAVDRALGRILRESTRQQTVLTEKETAEYLNQAASTLRQWRMVSRGPTFMKDHRGIRYHRKDLDAWLAANRVITSEAPDAPR